MRRLPDELRERNRDNLILAIALDVKENSRDIHTIFVSKDINLRIKADALGLDVEDYESDKVDIEELYSGYCEITVDNGSLSRFREMGIIEVDRKLYPNQYVSLLSREDNSVFALGRFDQAKNAGVRVVTEDRQGIWRISPHNREQVFAMDALLNDEIQLVPLVGKAGTGKTLLAVAASLYKTVDENIYSRILVSRPTLPMGKDIGFLPGTVEEKLTPWMYPIVDNVELIMRKDNRTSRHSLLIWGY